MGPEQQDPVIGGRRAVDFFAKRPGVAHAAVAWAEPKRLELVFEQLAFKRHIPPSGMYTTARFPSSLRAAGPCPPA